MRYTQFKAFEKHLQSSAPSNFSSLYCLIVKDSQERSLAFTELKRHLGAPETSQYIANPEGEKQLQRDLDTPSLFGGNQLYHLSCSEKLSKACMQELEKQFTRLPRNATLVLSAESISRQSSFYKAIEKHGVLLDILEEKPWEKEKGMMEWLHERAARLGVSLKPDAAITLVRGVDYSYALLSAELEKLLTYIGDRKTITLQDVANISTLAPVDSTWALGEAILQLNVKGALELSCRLLEQGNAVFALLRQLRHQMMTAMHLASAAESGNMQTIATKFPYLKGAMLDRQLHAAKSYGLTRLSRAIQLIDYYEFKAKDTWDDPELLLNMLIVKVTQ